MTPVPVLPARGRSADGLPCANCGANAALIAIAALGVVFNAIRQHLSSTLVPCQEERQVSEAGLRPLSLPGDDARLARPETLLAGPARGRGSRRLEGRQGVGRT